MKRKTSDVSSLVAARLKTERKAPPFLRLHSRPNPAQDSVAADCVLVRDRIQDLLKKLGGVISVGQSRTGRSAEEFRLIQACIDTTVDAVELLLAETHPDGSMLAGELRAIGFFSMKTGGCNDVAKNGLDRLERTLTRSAACLSVTSSSPAIGEVAASNYSSNHSATNDDLVEQISRLTRLDVLAQTCNQYSRASRRTTPEILKLKP
jgi:hypothetical protein